MIVRVIVLYCGCIFCFCFFKQKTAYELRISDWSSDVCSSDLLFLGRRTLGDDLQVGGGDPAIIAALREPAAGDGFHHQPAARRVRELAGQQQAEVPDRKSVV